MRPGRRAFRPVVAGLENRQLLSAATVSTIATFGGSNKAIVSNLVMDGQGNLYGTTSAGGEGATTKANATVFEIPNGSTKPVTLASFNGAKGYGISGVSLDAQGDLFGTFSGQGGGTGGYGSVFEIAKGSKTVKTVATFNGVNGMFPDGVVVDSQGDLFGTAAMGGAQGAAVVYEIPAGSNAISTVASFDGPGQAPRDLTIDGQGNLYGTNSGGGIHGAGSVFEIARGSNTVTPLASFNSLNGSGISNVVMDSQGNLYGTTEDGGQYGAGSIFEIPQGSNSVVPLASFDTLDGSGPDPVSGLVMDPQGNLYGTTEAGGANGDGTVFELNRSSGTLLNLTSFDSNHGTLVRGLTLDGHGNLIGSMDGTGGSGGTVFKFAVSPPVTQPATPVPASSGSSKSKTTKVVAAPQLIARSHQTLMKQKLGEVKTAKKG